MELYLEHGDEIEVKYFDIKDTPVWETYRRSVDKQEGYIIYQTAKEAAENDFPGMPCCDDFQLQKHLVEHYLDLQAMFYIRKTHYWDDKEGKLILWSAICLAFIIAIFAILGAFIPIWKGGWGIVSSIVMIAACVFAIRWIKMNMPPYFIKKEIKEIYDRDKHIDAYLLQVLRFRQMYRQNIASSKLNNLGPVNEKYSLKQPLDERFIQLVLLNAINGTSLSQTDKTTRAIIKKLEEITGLNCKHLTDTYFYPESLIYCLSRCKDIFLYEDEECPCSLDSELSRLQQYGITHIPRLNEFNITKERAFLYALRNLPIDINNQQQKNKLEHYGRREFICLGILWLAINITFICMGWNPLEIFGCSILSAILLFLISTPILRVINQSIKNKYLPRIQDKECEAYFEALHNLYSHSNNIYRPMGIVGQVEYYKQLEKEFLPE